MNTPNIEKGCHAVTQAENIRDEIEAELGNPNLMASEREALQALAALLAKEWQEGES